MASDPNHILPQEFVIECKRHYAKALQARMTKLLRECKRRALKAGHYVDCILSNKDTIKLTKSGFKFFATLPVRSIFDSSMSSAIFKSTVTVQDIWSDSYEHPGPIFSCKLGVICEEEVELVDNCRNIYLQHIHRKIYLTPDEALGDARRFCVAPKN